nr:hypothetical protein [Tanacetum cinerariifolium]
MVAYLSKSDASEGFNQIIDFLNGSSIKYTLMVNSNIYVSCIKQLWTTVVVKQVNDVTRLQALVDKKKVVVTEAAIRECMSAKRTSWNEFSSSMSSAVICLSTGDLSPHNTKYASPALTQKNKRLRKKETHMSMLTKLLLVMMFMELLVLLMEKFLLLLKNHPYHLLHHLLHHHNHLKIFLQHIRRVEHLEYDKVAQALEITKLKRRVKKLEKRNKVRVLKLRRLQRVGAFQRVDTSDDTVMDDASNQGRMIAEMDKDDAVVLMDDKKVEEAKVDKTAQLITKVVTAASETVTAASAIIPTAEPYVPAATLTATPVRVAAAPSRRRKGVIIRDSKEESTTSTIVPAETKSKDKGKGILVEEPKPLKKKQQIEYQAMKRKPQTEAQARKNMMMYLKNVAGFKLDYFKGMSYDDIRLIFEAMFNSNVDFLLKTKEQMEEEENRALQTINETPAEKAAKRRKLNEDVEDLKRHLQIVPNEDDNV